MKFKALITFSSPELNNSIYVQNQVYNIKDEDVILSEMSKKWVEAQKFTPINNFTVLGIPFVAGTEYYYLPGDELEPLILTKESTNDVTLGGVGIITFNIKSSGGEVEAGATKINIV